MLKKIVDISQLYALHLTRGDDAELLTEEEIAAHMLQILRENVTILKRRLPVGILTTLKRDKWGEIRELLVKDETNRKMISTIEKSMMIICFDLDEIDGCFNKTIIEGGNGEAHKTPSRDETSMAHQMIHGCGSDANSGNRWFDKTIQVSCMHSFYRSCTRL